MTATFRIAALAALFLGAACGGSSSTDDAGARGDGGVVTLDCAASVTRSLRCSAPPDGGPSSDVDGGLRTRCEKQRG